MVIFSLLSLALAGPVLVGPTSDPLVFPQDHGMHPQAQTEWWYLQGRVHTEDGRELSVFLSALRHDPSQDRVLGMRLLRPARAGLLFFGCVADLASSDRLAERSAFGVVPAPGHKMQGAADWVSLRARRFRAHGGGGRFTWQVPVRGGSLRLHSTPTVAPLLIGTLEGDPGDEAVGRARFPHAAFSYYSMPRVQLHGELIERGVRTAVSGTGWVDHQWGFIYSDAYEGWWWLALMLDDGTDLMLTVVTPRGGEGEPVVLGSLRRPGEQAVVTAKFEVEWLDPWTSERTGASYPSAIIARLPTEGIELMVRPVRADLEWKVRPAPIWEGPVTVTGLDGVHRGSGYAELLVKGDQWTRRIFSSGDHPGRSGDQPPEIDAASPPDDRR